MATLTVEGIPSWVRQRFIESRTAPLSPPPAPPGEALVICSQKVRYGSPEEPPEYCDEEVVPGLELCQDHADRNDDADWDLYREQRFV